MNFVITGTSKGIGLELTKVAIKEGHTVYAIARNLSHAKDLNELAAISKGKLHLIDVDLGLDDSVELIFKALQSVEEIDVLINNAGIYRDDESIQSFSESFKVNTIVPYFLIKKLTSKLKKSSGPKVFCLSSTMGSIAENSSGGSHSYRSSKSALNMIIKGLSIEEPSITFAVTHPGWVQTQMGGSGAQITVEESVSGLWKVLLNLKNSESGIYIDYQGRKLPW